ncbi:hypothetical protein BZM27_54715, partial [Paraburkholderia steynii]
MLTMNPQLAALLADRSLSAMELIGVSVMQAVGFVISTFLAHSLKGKTQFGFGYGALTVLGVRRISYFELRIEPLILLSQQCWAWGYRL